MPTTRTTFCAQCRALRWIEDWREIHDEMMSIALGPCGHVIERTARLEWSLPRLRLVTTASLERRVATS